MPDRSQSRDVTPALKTRKSHKKSRKGCQPCKRRRIKCDEGGPPCACCAIRGLDCTYGPDQPPTSSKAVDESQPSQSATITSTPDTTLPTDVSREISTPAATLPPKSPSDNASVTTSHQHHTELELMHHYTSHTYKSISTADFNDSVWQDFVPSQAFQHPFLLQAIFGATTLHLCHYASSPTEQTRYRRLTRHYQDLAFAAFSAALPHFDKSNCHAMFAFSIFAMIFAIAAPPDPATPPSQPQKALDRVFTLFNFLNSIGTIAATGWVWMSDGPFGPYFDIDNRIEVSPLSVQDREMLSRLRKLNDNLLAFLDPSGCSAVTQALDALQKVMGTGEMLVMGWLSMCGERFVEMLKQSHRLALLVFLHWTIPLNRLRRLWWVEDMAERLVEEVGPELEGLGDEWRVAVEEVRVRVGVQGD